MAKYNPERKTWRGRSYKAGGKRIRELKYRQVLPVLAAVTFLLLAGCEASPQEKAARAAADLAYAQTMQAEQLKKAANALTEEQQKAAEDEAENREYGNKLVRQIVYLKDERTNICFAYVWGGMANGGPALTTVPCVPVVTNLIK